MRVSACVGASATWVLSLHHVTRRQLLSVSPKTTACAHFIWICVALFPGKIVLFSESWHRMKIQYIRVAWCERRYAAAGHGEGLEEGEPGEGKEDHAKEVINAEVSQGLADEKAGEAGTGEKKEEQEAAEEEEGQTAMQE